MRKETHNNNKQRNGDPTVYAAPAAAERKEKETTCVCVAFILIGKTQIEKYNPQKMDKNNSNQPLLSKMKKEEKRKPPPASAAL